METSLFKHIPRLFSEDEEKSMVFISDVWKAVPSSKEHFRFIIELVVDHCQQFPDGESTALWGATIRGWVERRNLRQAACW